MKSLALNGYRPLDGNHIDYPELVSLESDLLQAVGGQADVLPRNVTRNE